MKEGNAFRKDLYYRLQTHHINIPPLRERKQDIPQLINHFMEKASEQLGKKKPTPPKELFTLLTNYNFPGNIRELEGIIFDAVSVHNSGVMSLGPIRDKIHREENFSGEPISSEEGIIFSDQLPTLKDAEEALINEALRRAEGNQSIAADMLGLSRRALNNRLNRKTDSSS